MTNGMARLMARAFVIVSMAVFTLCGFGCGGDDNNASLSGQFAASSTASAVRLVKLVPGTASGSRVVVQAVIYGPDTSLDMYAFSFDVVIGNTAVLGYVPGSVVAGPALQTTGCDGISAIAGPDASDPTHIVVGVTKLGDCAGNGVSGSSAVVVSLSFDVLAQGTSTLAIATSPAPSVKDSNLSTIGGITFDSATGTVTAISTGGGGY